MAGDPGAAGIDASMRRLPTLGLILVSVIWGTTFVAVKTAMGYASPLLFVGVRFGLAALAALPLLPRRTRKRDRPRLPATADGRSRSSVGGAWRASIPLGAILAGAYVSQTIGLTVASPARSAFITGLNVVLVPFWVLAMHGRRPSALALCGGLLCLPGLWLLTSPDEGQWNRGDYWTVACAVLYALYVVRVNRAAERYSPGSLLFPQLATTAFLCMPGSLLFEAPRFEPAPALLAALALTAFLATTGTTWLQLACQPHVGPTRSAVIFATEPVFAALFSFLLLGERLPAIAWAGGALILAGMLLSELGAARR